MLQNLKQVEPRGPQINLNQDLEEEVEVSVKESVKLREERRLDSVGI